MSQPMRHYPSRCSSACPGTLTVLSSPPGTQNSDGRCLPLKVRACFERWLGLVEVQRPGTVTQPAPTWACCHIVRSGALLSPLPLCELGLMSHLPELLERKCLAPPAWPTVGLGTSVADLGCSVFLVQQGAAGKGKTAPQRILRGGRSSPRHFRFPLSLMLPSLPSHHREPALGFQSGGQLCSQAAAPVLRLCPTAPPPSSARVGWGLQSTGWRCPGSSGVSRPEESCLCLGVFMLL